VGWTEARMGVRLLGRAMLGQTVVAAIIYGKRQAITDFCRKYVVHIVLYQQFKQHLF